MGTFGRNFLLGYEEGRRRISDQQRQAMEEQELALRRQQVASALKIAEEAAKAREVARSQDDLKLQLQAALQREGPPSIPVSPEAGGMGPPTPGQREEFSALLNNGGTLSVPAEYRPEAHQRALAEKADELRLALANKLGEQQALLPGKIAETEAEEAIRMPGRLRLKQIEEGGQESRFQRTPITVQGTDDEGNPITSLVDRQGNVLKTFKARTSAGERLRVKDADAALASAQNLGQLYNPDWVGPIAGRAYALQEKVPGVEVDPLRSEFVAQNTALKNATIKFITGAQMSEPEARRIMKQIPDVNDKPTVWEAKYKATLNNTEILRRIMSGEISKKEGLEALGLPLSTSVKLGAPKPPPPPPGFTEAVD